MMGFADIEISLIDTAGIVLTKIDDYDDYMQIMSEVAITLVDGTTAIWLFSRYKGILWK